jgi:SAM-dependent methyltransferase
MSEYSRPYAIHSDEECDRLELQARLANIEGHLRYLPVSPGDRVLDVGCGSGSMSRLIARSYPQADVTGVDLREQYLDFALCRAREEDIQNLTFRSADAFALPFADATFDVVWTKYLLQWLKEPKRAATSASYPPQPCRASCNARHARPALRCAQGRRADREPCRRHGADFGRRPADRRGRRHMILG